MPHPLVPSVTFNVNAGAGGASGAAADQDIQTLQSTKNPALQAAIQAVLGQTASLSSDPTRNEYTVKANVKDAGQAARIGGAGSRFDTDVASNRESLDDFTKNYLAADPTAKANLDQESGAIGDWFGGPNSVQSALDRLAAQRKIAVAGSTAQALRHAQAAANVNRLLSGDSSYIDSMFSGTAADIMAREARDQSDLARTNYLTVKQAQPALAGRRNALLNDYLLRGLKPIEARQRLAANELNQLGNLGNLTQANTFYNLDTPETMLGRKLALLQGVSGLDLANNFYGTSKPYEPDFSGYPRFLYGYGGGGSPSPSFDFGSLVAPLPGPPTTTMGPGGRPLLNSGGTLPGLSEAERWAYKQQTGVDPTTDPYFSQESLNAIRGNLYGTGARRGNPLVDDYLPLYESYV